MAPDQAQKFCYMVDDVLVADFRLTFGWAGSSGHWGVMSEAAAHSHRNATTVETTETAEILPEGKAMMSHVKITEPCEIGRPTQVPPCVRTKNKDVPRGGPHELFSATVCVDDFIMARVQPDPTDQSALVASVASNHIRLFGPGEADATTILPPPKEHGLGPHRRLASFYGEHSHSTYSGNGREDCRHQTYARAGVATYPKTC